MALFRGGINLTEGNELKELAATETPLILQPSAVYIPLCIQKTSLEPCVTEGETVRVGTPLAQDPRGFLPPIHSGISGTVRAVGVFHPSAEGGEVPTIVIEKGGEKTAALLPPLTEDVSPEKIVQRMYEAGLVGMGGGGYPTHRKYQGLTAEWLLVNACECEPYLAADAALTRRFLPLIAEGTRLLAKAARVPHDHIRLCTESSHTAEVLRQSGLPTVALAKRYPQGSERQLTEAVLDKRLPDGVLPTQAGVVVSNVGTAAAMGDAGRGLPLTHRVITVSGYVKKPCNLLVPIGTRFADLRNTVELKSTDTRVRYIAGGPMTGRRLSSLEAGIPKTCGGLTILPSNSFPVTPCIRCGACVRACPSSLMPFLIEQAALQKERERYHPLRAIACISCGCCSFVCPAKRPLAARITAVKRELKEGKP